VDLQQVRYFLNLADTLNFSRAAELSQVKQPAITKAIQKLEDELGGPLIYRDGKDTRLSELGRNLRAEFEKIVASEMRVRELAEQVVNEDRSSLTIGVANTIGPERIGRFLASFAKEMPQLEIVVDSVNPKHANDLVLSGALDACFCVEGNSTNPKLQFVELYPERLLLATNSDHRFAEMSDIPPTEMSKENYIDRIGCEFRRQVADYFMDHNVLMRPQLRSDREDWVQDAIASGLGVAMIPEYSVLNRTLRLTPVKGMELSRKVHFIAVFGSASAPAARRLLEAVKKHSWLE
jgi:DNA-binding transcriptional LysR family regulator